jgi:hypothetical protein
MKLPHSLKLLSLILLLNLLKVNEGKAQAYIPLLNDSIYWDVSYYDMFVSICTEYNDPGKGPYRYALDGDTTINGTVYKKFKSYSFYSLQQQPSPNCPPFAIQTFTSTSQFNYGFLREDTTTRKVYSYDVNSSMENLLYDFNAQIGDSIYYQSYGDFIVDTVYNIVTLDGKTRKYFGADYSSFPFNKYYIEGLGGVGGPFHSPFIFFEFGPWLMCISDLNQNQIYQPNLNVFCYNFTTGINSIPNNQYALKIEPNPSTDYVNILANPIFGNIDQVVFHDLLGNVVLAPKQSSKISTTSLHSGLYLIKVMNDQGKIATSKFQKL